MQHINIQCLFVVAFLCGLACAAQPWLNPENPLFKEANKAQLDAISIDPLSDLWFQNITIYADDPMTGLVPVVNYGYWQSRIYNPNIGAFEEVQAWYRTATVLAIQQINSEVMKPEYTSDSNGGVVRQDTNYNVVWVTNKTFDSASVIGQGVKSNADGSNIVRISFFDPVTKKNTFTEELLTLIPKVRRRYTNTYVVDPTGATLPLTITFDSTAVDIAYQPPAVSAAFAAYRAGQVPKQEDPAAVAAGVPFNLVYLYTHPSSRDAIVDPFYAQFFGNPLEFNPVY